MYKQKEQYHTNESSLFKRFLLPVAIIVAGIVVAGVVLFAPVETEKVSATIFDTKTFALAPGLPGNVAPLTEDDHILGNPNAPIKIIEFSDFECQFCKVLHISMQQVMETYGKRGKVAWVYRHLPIESIHTKAFAEAVASECAGELGGNNAFWDFAGRIFEVTPSNDGLDLSLLPDIAEELNLDRAAFEECMQSGAYDDHIAENVRDALVSGASGTPYTIVVASGKEPLVFTGAQAYLTIASFIELMLKR